MKILFYGILIIGITKNTTGYPSDSEALTHSEPQSLTQSGPEAVTESGSEALTQIPTGPEAVTESNPDALRRGAENAPGDLRQGAAAPDPNSPAAPANPAGPAAPASPGGAAGNGTGSEQNMDEARLTVDPNEEPPEHAYTNRYGFPEIIESSTVYPLAQAKFRVISQQWRTFFTLPATKPNCLCLTRGPLSKFKLFGNIHFKNIKVPKPPPFMTTVASTSTVCPPCNCEVDCPPRLS